MFYVYDINLKILLQIVGHDWYIANNIAKYERNMNVLNHQKIFSQDFIFNKIKI